MKPANAAMLRMIGYLIQFVCLAVWFKLGSQDRVLLGVPVNNVALGGFFCGATLIFVSHFVKKTVPSRKPPRDFLNP